MKAGIAGAGIMGRLLAFALHNVGWDVSLFDQGGEDSCSYAAAGLLTHIAELEKNDLVIYQLGEEAINQHWPRVFSQLDNEVYFKQTGSLIVSHPRDQKELFRLMHMIDNKFDQKKVGSNYFPNCISDEAAPAVGRHIPVPHGLQHSLESNLDYRIEKNIYQRLNQAQIEKLEPQITKFQEGLYFPDEGQLDCQMILSALENHLRDITWYQDTFVQDVSPNKITLQDREYNFDVVFDCRGLGAKSRFSDLRGVRGELIWLHAPDVIIHRPIRLMHPRYSLYIAPRPNHIYLVGASEIESNDHSAISVRTVLELLTAVYSVHPGFSEARMVKTVTHCRPTLVNHLPKIKYTDGFIAINGLYRHGYLIAPTLMTEVMTWIQQGVSAVRYPELWEECA